MRVDGRNDSVAHSAGYLGAAAEEVGLDAVKDDRDLVPQLRGEELRWKCVGL